MGLLGPLYRFATGTYTVTRSVSNGYDATGHDLAPTTSTFSTQAVVQPMTGRELMLLPEAQRAEETQWFYSPVLMYTRSATTAPDVVTIANEQNVNESWVVDHVEKWNYKGVIFWRCRIARRNIP